MKWIDGLPYYNWDELNDIIQNFPQRPSGFMPCNNLVWHEHLMHSNMLTFLNYLGMYFEDHVDKFSKLKFAKNRLEDSITHNIDYIKIKHCKS